MKKDIIIPEPKGVKLAIVPQDENAWDLYLINENQHSIRNILVVTNAYNEAKVSSTLRYFLESMSEVAFIKFETVLGDVIELENVITMTYYVGMDIYEKEFRFSKLTLQEKTLIPILNVEGYIVD